MLTLAWVACAPPAPDGATPASASARPAKIERCAPTDQERFVYRPARLQELMPCIRVIGFVVSSSAEADGDYHINVRVDPEYEGLLNAANEAEDGYLIVEPVCQFPPLQAEAIRLCASDAEPLTGGLPGVGDHVWLEGRYALDLQHHGWAELHPLYRWGRVSP
jgi:hypothetical protein